MLCLERRCSSQQRLHKTMNYILLLLSLLILFVIVCDGFVIRPSWRTISPSVTVRDLSVSDSISSPLTGESNNEEETRQQVQKILEKDHMLSLQQKPGFATPLWDIIRYEASTISGEDLRTSALLANGVLVQHSLDEAIIDYLSNLLDTPLFTATQIRAIFHDVVEKNSSIARAWSTDLMATALNDHSYPNILSILFFNKGFHALASYRIANSLWYSGRDGLARHFQSLISRTFAADFHPACHIGPGCYVASGSEIVIGETASIGRDCSIMHGVTLGGTGKESGDRHPKVGNRVFLAAGATVLGNIKIGDGSIVNAGSVVTKPVEPFTRVGGVPAKFVSNVPINAVDLSALSESLYVDDDTDLNEVYENFMYDLRKLRAIAPNLPKSA